MGSENRPVCHRCAQIKQACDGSLPCARCVRLSLPCRPRDSGDAGGVGVDGQKMGDMPKARIRRVQTGCLMCKRRKKKCDEMKPRCGDCRRLCLDCAWPVQRSKDKAAAAAASSSASSSSSATAAASAMVMAPTPPRDMYMKTETACSSPPMMMMKIAEVMATDVMVALRDSRSPTPSLSSSRRGYSVHDRHDNNSGHSIPSSSPSNVSSEYDGGLLGQASPPRVAWMDSYHTPVSYGSPPDDYCVDPTTTTMKTMTRMTTSSASLTMYVPQVLPQLSASQDRALLHHYTTIVSSILSRRPSLSNPYNNHLLPLASCNDTILHCILALSASHWRKLQPQLADRGLHHQSRATRALARLLPHVGRSRASMDVALVCCLLLCMTELFDGTSEGWKLHLKGAKKLLTTLLSQQGGDAAATAVPNGHHKFLLRLAKFLDSAATVSTCRPPLMGEDEHEAATLDRLTAFAHADDDDEGAVYGIPKELFHLVDVINALADKRKTRVDEASESLFRDEAARVENRINGWAAAAAAASSTTTTAACDGCQVNDKDILQATAAYEHAIRLRLHQIVEGYGLEDEKVVVHVDGILDSVQRIRYGSPLEACLLFPLVMAGGACWTMEQRVVIYDRLMVMERTCGFGYIYNARDLVQRVWRLRDETEGTGVDVNWARIRYEEMHGLVVF